MNDKKSVKKHRKGDFLKKLFFVLLFIILLPFMAIGYLIKFFVDKKRKKKWEENGMRGKLLVLSTNIEDVDKMPPYILKNYLKTLFFYDECSVSEINDKKGNMFLVSKHNIKSLVCFIKLKKEVCSKYVMKTVKNMNKVRVGQAYIVTNSVFSSQASTLAKEKNILLIDREELAKMQAIVKQKLGLTTKKEDLIDKFDMNIQDKFPNMI